MKKSYYSIFVMLLVLLPPKYAYTQGQANNWYFGANAGLTFNTNPPTALTNGMLSTSEGCATLSDAAGNLLFYTDGINVWSANHVLMPNGTGLLGHPSSAQSGIIIPRPGTTSNYYIITVPENGAVGMRYSEVDMTLNGGLGDVLTTNKNTLMFAPSSEKVTAVKHANGLYYWVLGRQNGASTAIRAFLIDCNGVNTTPVSSNGVIGGGNWGYMVASPDGSRIASATSGYGIELADFDNATGIVSNPLGLGVLNYAGFAGGEYGVAFSQNGQVLYGTSITNWALVQWDLTAPNISASQLLISYTNGSSVARPSYRGGALQLAPDGRIYVPDIFLPSLSAINNPNTVGPGCNFQSNVVNLQGRNSILGLPPFIQSFFDTTSFGINYNGVCLGQPTQFSVNGSPSLDSLNWDFGDPALGISVSNATAPVHTFGAPGTYTVRLIRFLDCITDTTFAQVQILPLPLRNLSVNLCPGASYVLPGGASVSTAGIYTDTLPGAASTGCDSIVITTVTASPIVFSAGNDTSICIGTSAILDASDALSYSWTPTATLSDPTIANPVASPVATTSYIVTSTIRTGANLVNNGDFEQGNIGFSSSYVYTPPGNFSQGHYNVDINPINYNGGFMNCGDHTSGAGNMMIMDASCGTNGVAPSVTVWCQTIAVTPNTDYAFSAWLTNFVTGNTASTLEFSINGNAIGAPAITPAIGCQWNEFYSTWNSGNATTVNICITEQSGVCSGNDFALDDISFMQICTVTDTVIVTVSDPQAAFTDSANVLCFGGNDGSAVITPSSGFTPYAYAWSDGQSDSTAIQLTAGNYSVVVTDQIGCTVSNSILITEPAQLTASINSSTNVSCNGGSDGNATVTAGGGTPGYTYQWLPIADSVSFIQNLSAATYTVVVTDSNNCTVSDSIIVTEPVALTLTLTATGDSICFGDSTTISAAANGGTGNFIFTWNNALQNGISHTVSPAANLTYEVIAYDGNNCTDTATVAIHVSPLPVAAFSATDVCEGLFNAFTDQSTVTSGSVTGFSWDMGDLSPQLTQQHHQYQYAAYGTYNVSLAVVTDMGCHDTITHPVTVFPLPVADFSGDDLSGCMEHCVSFTDQSTTAGAPVNAWSWWQGTSAFASASGAMHCFDTAGVYDITLAVTTADGCSDTLTISNYITVYQLPQAGFYTDRISIPLSEGVILINDSSVNAVQWQWDLGDGTFLSGNAGTHIYSDTGIYCIGLIVTSGDGCRDTMQQCVHVYSDFSIYIPNTFTPNNDNINDIFKIVGRGIGDLEMIIYDRWGAPLVTLIKDQAIVQGWDGTYNGELVKQDVYVYRINYRDESGNMQSINGHVNVIY